MVASLAPLAAALLWKSYGGSVYPPELASVALGHVLNAGLTMGLAFAAAALTEHPSTAAILTLSVTVGTWILNFIAAVQGGIWERIAGYTPPAMVAQFQHGLIRLDVVLIAHDAGVSGLCTRRPLAAPRRVGAPPLPGIDRARGRGAARGAAGQRRVAQLGPVGKPA